MQVWGGGRTQMMGRSPLLCTCLSANFAGENFWLAAWGRAGVFGGRFIGDLVGERVCALLHVVLKLG